MKPEPRLFARAKDAARRYRDKTAKYQVRWRDGELDMAFSLYAPVAVEYLRWVEIVLRINDEDRLSKEDLQHLVNSGDFDDVCQVLVYSSKQLNYDRTLSEPESDEASSIATRAGVALDLIIDVIVENWGTSRGTPPDHPFLTRAMEAKEEVADMDDHTSYQSLGSSVDTDDTGRRALRIAEIHEYQRRHGRIIDGDSDWSEDSVSE